MNSEDTSSNLEPDAEDSGATSREIQMCTISTDFPTDATINLSDLRCNRFPDSCRPTQGPSFVCSTSYSTEIQADTSSMIPYLFINRPTSFVMSPIASQPLRIGSSPKLIHRLPNQPKSLFLQALSKLNDSSISVAVINHLRNMSYSPNQSVNKMSIDLNSAELSPPNSLTSAPPSYSFVLRQMAMRRRPRLMGTFIPSPSFVQHTPPPNYATAFDIYVDNAIPPPRPRVYHFGYTPMPIVCPECGYNGLTIINTKVTICTHLSAVILCLFCCWICAPLPYVLRSCKDVYHYCRNCRNFLGMYCPTSPEQPYSQAC
ncbi:uncharacterized protein [Epargyreus clarus]|uniref:uncharacterized protein n=1 Tax=Epargyreus clarus TaxID=520877 RepID=UPI003C2C170B